MKNKSYTLQIINELSKNRALLNALVVRHLSVRYRGSMLGFLWSFLNPLCFMLIYSLVFRYYIRFNEVDNYSIFLFCGLLPWIWTQSALLESVSSISGSGHLITKSLFPAHILPTVSVITTLINFILSLPLLFIFMAFAKMEFHFTLIGLPLLIAIQSLFLLGISHTIASLNVYYRDIQHVIAHLLNFVFFLCPILYPIETVPEKFRFTLFLNPFAVYMDAYHALVLDGRVPSLSALLYLIIWAMLSFLIGSIVYSRTSEHFAEAL